MAGLFGADGQVEVLDARSIATREHHFAVGEAEGAGEQLRNGLVGGAFERWGRDAHAENAAFIEALDGVPAGTRGDSHGDAAHGPSVRNAEPLSQGLRTGVLFP